MAMHIDVPPLEFPHFLADCAFSTDVKKRLKDAIKISSSSPCGAQYVASALKRPYVLRMRSVAEKAFSRKSKKEEILQ